MKSETISQPFYAQSFSVFGIAKKIIPSFVSLNQNFERNSIELLELVKIKHALNKL